MNNEVIDVDFIDVIEPEKGGGSGNNDLVINTDPLAALISGISSTVQTYSNNARAYKVAKEHEKTQRARIKAEMEIEMAQIDAQKEMLIKRLDDYHAEQMKILDSHHQTFMNTLNVYIAALQIASECAAKENDFDNVFKLMDKINEFMGIRNDLYCKIESHSNIYPQSNLFDNKNPRGYLN